MAKINKAALFLLATTLAASTSGQERKDTKRERLLVESREQAEGWYLPVHGEVTRDGKKAQDVTVKVFKENEELGTFPADKSGEFDLELDLDFVFTLLIESPGCQLKIINVDTHLPKDLVKYPAYECFVNMEAADKTSAADPFYLDFPSAIVRYNEELGGYYHSEAYLQHIHNKLYAVSEARF